MSTYNGEEFVEEQIKSILAQVDIEVNLIVRDDNSTDGTRLILEKLSKDNPNISVIWGEENLGACRSFLFLISRYSKSDYIALADQDDIWDCDKLSQAIKLIEGSSIPVLYHSNLRIVDRNGQFIRNAHRHEQIEKTQYSFLCEPLPTGCTIVYNKALAQLVVGKIPKDFSMHDTWLYYVAALFGKVIYDFTPHVDYRQHEKNVVGTSRKLLSKKTIRQQFNKVFNNNQYQQKNAQYIYDLFCERLSIDQKKKIYKVLNYKDSLSDKIKLLSDKDIRPDMLFRTLRYFLKVIIGKF